MAGGEHDGTLEVGKGVIAVSAMHASPVRAHRLRFDPWHVAVVVLAAALLALAAWVVVDGAGGRTRDEALVDDLFAAWNARDGDAVGRLYTGDAVVTFGIDDPSQIMGRSAIQKAAEGWGNTVTRVGEATTLDDPAGGFTVPVRGVNQHYVVIPVLIHADPFVVVLDVRNGKVATHMMFEPFEPFRS